MKKGDFNLKKGVFLAMVLLVSALFFYSLITNVLAQQQIGCCIKIDGCENFVTKSSCDTIGGVFQPTLCVNIKLCDVVCANTTVDISVVEYRNTQINLSHTWVKDLGSFISPIPRSFWNDCKDHFKLSPCVNSFCEEEEENCRCGNFVLAEEESKYCLAATSQVFDSQASCEAVRDKKFDIKGKIEYKNLDGTSITTNLPVATVFYNNIENTTENSEYILKNVFGSGTIYAYAPGFFPTSQKVTAPANIGQTLTINFVLYRAIGVSTIVCSEYDTENSCKETNVCKWCPNATIEIRCLNTCAACTGFEYDYNNDGLCEVKKETIEDEIPEIPDLTPEAILCGNGVLDDGEECDYSVPGTTNCDYTCKFIGSQDYWDCSNSGLILSAEFSRTDKTKITVSLTENPLSGCSFISKKIYESKNNGLYFLTETPSHTYAIPDSFERRNICFVAKGVLDDGADVYTEPVCLNSGDYYCRISSKNYCEDNQIYSCSENLILENVSCGEQAYCRIENKNAVCTTLGDLDICDKANNPFGVFWKDSVKEGTRGLTTYIPADLLYCYLDKTRTPVDKYYNCSNILSCYDYHSENTCNNDKCGISTDCEWKTNADTAGKFGLGVCRPKEQSEQNCGLYKDAISNPLFMSDALTCSLAGNCYLTKALGNNICFDTKDITCYDYMTENDCTWGVELVVNELTNEINPKSDDKFDLGTCVWSDYCFKDADGNGIDDCKSEECMRDNTPPITTVQNQTIYGDKAKIYFEAGDNLTGVAETYYCFDNDRTCYPDIPVGNKNYFENTDNNNTLRYYSVDKAKNLEVVKQLNLGTLDLTYPTVLLTLSNTSKLSMGRWATDLKIEIYCSDDNNYCLCEGNMTKHPENMVYSDLAFRTKGDPISKSIIYPNLMDGKYEYTLICEDGARNRVIETKKFELTADEIKINPSNYETFRADDDLEFKFTTKSDSTCNINIGGDLKTLTQNNKSATISKEAFGISDEEGYHEYEISCKFPGGRTLSGKSENAFLSYFIDETPPVTAISRNIPPSNNDYYKMSDKGKLILNFNCYDYNPELVSGSYNGNFEECRVICVSGCGAANTDMTNKSLTISSDKEIKFFSRDAGLNQEEQRTINIKFIPDIQLSVKAYTLDDLNTEVSYLTTDKDYVFVLNSLNNDIEYISSVQYKIGTDSFYTISSIQQENPHKFSINHIFSSQFNNREGAIILRVSGSDIYGFDFTQDFAMNFDSKPPENPVIMPEGFYNKLTGSTGFYSSDGTPYPIFSHNGNFYTNQNDLFVSGYSKDEKASKYIELVLIDYQTYEEVFKKIYDQSNNRAINVPTQDIKFKHADFEGSKITLEGRRTDISSNYLVEIKNNPVLDYENAGLFYEVKSVKTEQVKNKHFTEVTLDRNIIISQEAEEYEILVYAKSALPNTKNAPLNWFGEKVSILQDAKYLLQARARDDSFNYAVDEFILIKDSFKPNFISSNLYNGARLSFSAINIKYNDSVGVNPLLSKILINEKNIETGDEKDYAISLASTGNCRTGANICDYTANFEFKNRHNYTVVLKLYDLATNFVSKDYSFEIDDDVPKIIFGFEQGAGFQEGLNYYHYTQRENGDFTLGFEEQPGKTITINSVKIGARVLDPYNLTGLSATPQIITVNVTKTLLAETQDSKDYILKIHVIRDVVSPVISENTIINLQNTRGLFRTPFGRTKTIFLPVTDTSKRLNIEFINRPIIPPPRDAPITETGLQPNDLTIQQNAGQTPQLIVIANLFTGTAIKPDSGLDYVLDVKIPSDFGEALSEKEYNFDLKICDLAGNCVTITNLKLVVDDKKPVYPSGFSYTPSAITWDEEIKTGKAGVDFRLTTPDDDIKEVSVFVVGVGSTRLNKNANDFSGRIMLSGDIGEEISNSIYFEITDYATNIINTDYHMETIEVVILDQKPPEGEFK